MSEQDHVCPTCGGVFKQLAKRVVLLESRDSVMIDGKHISLTASEFIVFETLWQTFPRTSNYDYLITNLYNLDEPAMPREVVQFLVHNLRKAFTGTNVSILNARELGYRLQLAELNQMEIAA